MNSVIGNTQSKRIVSIDVLRFIAILGIIIIHCDPQCFFVRQLRNFDVPLMVFLAGVSYGMSSQKKKSSYGEYVWKRFKRMVLPTWIFLLLMTLVTFITTNTLPEREWLISTFSLTTRTWYVWIIRVLFIMCVLAPLTIPYINQYFTARKYWIIGIISLFVLELMPHSPEELPLYLLLEFIPFFLIFVLGCEVTHFSKNQLLVMATVSFAVYLIYVVVLYVNQSQLVNTQVDKYPPRVYYLSYSLACISILWVFKDNIVVLCDKLKITGLFCFIGSHSLWIYFWHIAVLHIMFYITDSFWLRFVVVFCSSFILTFIQNLFISFIVAHSRNEWLNGNLKLIFNG